MRRIGRRALAALPLAACGSKATPPPPPSPPPPLLVLELQGGADQNPDASGQANPVALQLFLLAATARFERADVFALAERAEATLGGDATGSEQVILAPGERRLLEMPPKPGTVKLGVAALFRDADTGAIWRAMAPVAATGHTRLLLRTGGNRVSLAPAP